MPTRPPNPHPANPHPGSTPRPRPAAGHGGPAISNRTKRSPGSVAADSAAWLRAVGGRVLAVATGEAGQRLARAVGLAVALAVLVTTLYERGEVPTAAAQPAVRTPAGGAGTAAPGRVAVRRKAPGGHGGLRGRERPAPVGERPAAVATAWYAARHGVPPARVRPLQQDRRSAREVRVLVLADLGRGRLRTALVRLRLGRDGWSVR
jgi:hypothetical protein